jgi:hypothetical protein
MSRFFQEWKSYRQGVLPFVPQEHVQHKETMRAFYAGGWAMLMMLKGISGDEDTGVKFLQNLEDELRQFQQDVLDDKK